MQAYSKKTQYFFSLHNFKNFSWNLKFPDMFWLSLLCMNEWGKEKNVPGSKIATIIYSWQGCEFLKISDFLILEVCEEPRSNKFYYSGNLGVKKVQDLGERGTGNSLCHPYTQNLHPCKQYSYYTLHFWMWDLKNIMSTGSNRWPFNPGIPWNHCSIYFTTLTSEEKMEGIV